MRVSLDQYFAMQ